MPRPATQYRTAKIAISVPDSQPPQAIGTAATRAANGITTNAHSPIKTPLGCGPSVRGLAPRMVFSISAAPVALVSRSAVRTSAAVLMAPHCGLLSGAGLQDYGCGLRLRHRNLRD